jgi:fructose-bisphosphate aldolase class I
MKKNTKLYETVAALMASGKGILAADESDATAGKRLAMVHLPNEAENRQDFRELLFAAPGIEEYLSGVIMYDSSIKSSTDIGIPFPHGFKGEVVSQGLDGLADRFAEYYDLGARFAKWRAVITIDDEDTPTDAAITMNCIFLARYAQLAQAAGIVPMVEPEVIYAGDHSLARAEQVTTRTLQILFQTLQNYRVDLEGLILKSSMVLAGDMNPEPSSPEQIANATLRTFHMSVPYDVGGIVFLSGGQTPKRSTENLNAIAKLGGQPWPITFSYSRAIEEPVLMAWQGKPENIPEAQKMLLHAAKMNSLASLGKYEATKDNKLS